VSNLFFLVSRLLLLNATLQNWPTNWQTCCQQFLVNCDVILLLTKHVDVYKKCIHSLLFLRLLLNSNAQCILLVIIGYPLIKLDTFWSSPVRQTYDLTYTPPPP
jgi:hypothetical protein